MSSDSLSCLQSLADTEAGHQLRDFNELSVSKNGCVPVPGVGACAALVGDMMC